jgi:hypothetical protein
MADLSSVWQQDLSFSLTSDVLLASGSQVGQQRVLRRLLTNPGDYFAHPTYGAGLPTKVGSLATAAELQAIVLSQMLQEQAVSQDPPPTVSVTTILNGVSILVTYTDSVTAEPVTLGFDINQ